MVKNLVLFDWYPMILWNNMDVVAVTKCWYQWIHFCSVLVQRSSSTDSHNSDILPSSVPLIISLSHMDEAGAYAGLTTV